MQNISKCWHQLFETKNKFGAVMQEMIALNLTFLIVLPHERVPGEAISFLKGHLDGETHLSRAHTITLTPSR